MTSDHGPVDPVTFEIIRHRLWRITEEQAKIVVRMSGSPITYEAKDFSTGILTPEGDGLFISPYQSAIGVTLCSVAKAVIAQFGDDVAAADMFFCNDPWLGGVGHPNDQALVGPLHYQGKIVGWTGVVLHDGDVGATVPGVHPAAPDSRHEGPLIPPVRLVQRGVLRRDLENWVVRTVRDPAANSLHIRCRMAAIVNTQKQIGEILDQVGAVTYSAFVADYIRRLAGALKARLRELPDGTWREEILMDHDGRSANALARVHCQLTKQDASLIFDFRHTDPPVPGPVNCAPKALDAAVYAAVMSTLCYDTGWCPAALHSSVEIITKPNTVVTAAYPTPVGLATVAAMSTAGACVRACISQMFAASSAYRERSRAFSGMAGTGSLIWGLGHDGLAKFTLGSFVVSRGAGAYCGIDGEDAGGNAGSPAASIYNVETIELANPVVLTLYRKLAPQTAGPGQFRGGAGMEIAFAIRAGFGTLHVNWGSMGFHHPHPKGLFGGLPGSVAGVQVLRRSNAAQLLAAGQPPRGRDEISCESVEQMEAKTVDEQLEPGDLLAFWVEGGGGYGDPIERDPARVREDVQSDSCSPQLALDLYGVALDPGSLAVNEAGTSALRAQLRAARLGSSAAVGNPAQQVGNPAQQARRMGPGVPRGAGLAVVETAGTQMIACSHCGHLYGPAAQDPKTVARVQPLPFTAFSALNRYAFDKGEVQLREFLCPSCGTRMATELRKSADPVLS